VCLFLQPSVLLPPCSHLAFLSFSRSRTDRRGARRGRLEFEAGGGGGRSNRGGSRRPAPHHQHVRQARVQGVPERRAQQGGGAGCVRCARCGLPCGPARSQRSSGRGRRSLLRGLQGMYCTVRVEVPIHNITLCFRLKCLNGYIYFILYLATNIFVSQYLHPYTCH
jgi:hypothetical protein